MQILMKKQKENSEFVWYSCEDEFPVGEYFDKKGRARIKYERKFGIFEYNKKRNDFRFILKETDQVFLNNERIKFACWARMNDCRTKNEYPDAVVHASC